MKGTLVVQSLRVNIDSWPRMILRSYWVRDSIFAMIWPFFGSCWLSILGCGGLGLWHIDVGAGAGGVQGVLMIDTRWIRSWV